MANFQKIKQDIKDEIRPNGIGSITGKVMQDILVEVVETAEELFEEQGEAIDTANEEITEIKNSVQNNSAEITKANEEITKTKNELSKKANDNDYYPKMSVGFADNLVGREVATPAQFTYRASAGKKNIGDEGARIKRIKGNSVVWNQLVGKLNVTNSSGLTFSFNKDTNILTIDGVATSNWAGGILSSHSDTPGHTIFLRVAKVGGTYTQIEGGTRKLWVYSGYVGGNGNAIEGTGMIYVADGHINLGLVCNVGDVFENCQIRVTKNDLTQMFTSGNEPATVEEFYARIPSGIDIFAYNKGKIINLNTEAIKTVGFNQWDEQWVNGQANANVLNGLRSADFIQVLPNTWYYLNNGDYKSNGVVQFYDEKKEYMSDYPVQSDKKFITPSDCKYIIFYIPTDADKPVTHYNNNVCLNLSHTEYKNGTYSPYRTFTRQLPDLGVMRSAGNAFDEIRFNVDTQKWEKVTRIGERAYQLGDENNDAVTTDGKAITNYELAEPIIDELDWPADTNLDYAVEDFGTEEAISSVPSAPFSADIIYPFNAVDTIRQNERDIADLKAAIQQMSATMSINREE